MYIGHVGAPTEDRSDRIEAEWRHQRPDLDPSSIGVVTRVWELAKIFGDRRRRLLAELDVDPALMDLLGLLRRNGPPHAMSTRELTERAMVSAGAISQRLARAEARDWVRRVPGPARQVVVELTDEGRETVDRVAGLIFAADDEALAGLSDRQRRDLASLLRRLTSALGTGGPLPHVGGE
jgi:DNA-binding MarR family transcriptional regulator